MAVPNSHNRLKRNPTHLNVDNSSDSTLVDEKVEEPDIQKSILDELRALNAFHTEQAAQPPDRHEYHRNLAMNASVAILGIVFGIFSILSWVSASRANILADMGNGMDGTANELGLLAFCQSLPNTTSFPTCDKLLSTTDQQLDAIYQQILSLSNQREDNSGSSININSNGDGNNSLNTGADSNLLKLTTSEIVGIVIGVITGLATLAALLISLFSSRMAFLQKKRKAQQFQPGNSRSRSDANLNTQVHNSSYSER